MHAFIILWKNLFHGFPAVSFLYQIVWFISQFSNKIKIMLTETFVARFHVRLNYVKLFLKTLGIRSCKFRVKVRQRSIILFPDDGTRSDKSRRIVLFREFRPFLPTNSCLRPCISLYNIAHLRSRILLCACNFPRWICFFCNRYKATFTPFSS